MKLLVVTQKIDPADPILGFFMRWISAFAKHCDEVFVIGQYMGVHSLPANVHVYSLGKEKHISRWHQIRHFWLLQWQLRNRYDCVFVHMTPVWVVLGAPLWLLSRKPVYLWYEARGGGWALPVALRFVRKVFSATAHGLPRRAKKHSIVGHGVDTAYFTPVPEAREEGLVVTVGRITEVKHLDVIVQAFMQLPESCRLVIVGGPITKADSDEERRLQTLIDRTGIRGRVRIGPASHDHVRSLLQRASLLLHAGSGGLDKIILEAMACGCPVVASSVAARGVLPEQCLCSNEAMADRAKQILSLPKQERAVLAADLRKRVEEGHSLQRLVEKLVAEMKSEE